ncbi:MAG TPA: class II glutamine amidotransferase [Thermotogota bacterium]|nr:class II glutamine amidotransferase [Thermotogota bacterium]
MCRMLGVISSKPQRIGLWIPALEIQAKTGMHHPHSDGYGVAFYKDRTLHLRHEVRPVWERSPIVNEDETGTCLVMHARKASKGATTLDNVQPFYARSDDWQLVYCHNGTVRDIDRLDGSEEFLEKGLLDSAVMFHRLIDSLPFYDDLPACMMALILEVEGQCRNWTSLNALFSNGTSLGAVRSCAVEEDYYTLYVGRGADHAVVSTEPFGAYEWALIPNRTLWIFGEGQERFIELDRGAVL